MTNNLTSFNSTSTLVLTSATLFAENESDLQVWELAAQIIAALVFSVSIITMCYASHFHGKNIKASDPANYISLFQFFHGVGDFWTDCIFCFILYLQDYFSLFYVSLACVLVSYFGSMIFGVHMVHEWIRQMYLHDTMGKYLRQYDVMLYGLMILAGFYPSLAIAQSKLFYKRMFHMPLTRFVVHL